MYVKEKVISEVNSECPDQLMNETEYNGILLISSKMEIQLFSMIRNFPSLPPLESLVTTILLSNFMSLSILNSPCKGNYVVFAILNGFILLSIISYTHFKCCCTLKHFLNFQGGIFHCVYIPHSVNPLVLCQTYRLFLHLGYCE